jgi:hypothetical protein
MPGILDQLTGALKGVVGGGRAQQAPARVGYPSSLSLINGDAAYNTEALVEALLGGAGAVRRIWEFTVPAQQGYAWGVGDAAFPDNQGYMFFAIMDEGTAFEVGLVHLGYENHSRRLYVPVASSIHDSRLHSTTNTTMATARLLAKDEMYPLPEADHLPIVGQDSRLVIDYTTIVAVGAGIDAIDFNIPVTIYE